MDTKMYYGFVEKNPENGSLGTSFAFGTNESVIAIGDSVHELETDTIKALTQYFSDRAELPDNNGTAEDALERGKENADKPEDIIGYIAAQITQNNGQTQVQAKMHIS